MNDWELRVMYIPIEDMTGYAICKTNPSDYGRPVVRHAVRLDGRPTAQNTATALRMLADWVEKMADSYE